MQLASGTHIPDGLLAASVLLSENSHQGFDAPTHTLHQGFRFAISHTSLGIIGTLYDGDVRSRCTGKERDTESGLDYFGARYYASSMGRWMSPDWADKPEAVPYSSLDNPQSLNLYGYVLNNPLSHTDLDGHQCDWCSAFGRGAGDATLVPLWYAVHHPITTGIATAKALFTPGLGTAIGNTLEAAKHGDAYALGQLTGVGVSAYVMSGIKWSHAAAASNASAGETLAGFAQNACCCC